MPKPFITNVDQIGRGGRAITTSDAADQDDRFAFRFFEVTVAGDVSIIDPLTDATLLLPARAVGVRHEIGVSRFRATGTTATGIIAWL
jgi:hypothetical protein